MLSAPTLPLRCLEGVEEFASLGLIVTSVAGGYDSFNYYFTFFIGPMFFFSGIFFPVKNLGPWVERLSWAFPLTHLVGISRSLLAGTAGAPPILSLGVATLVAVAAFAAASFLMKRRFMV